MFIFKIITCKIVSWHRNTKYTYFCEHSDFSMNVTCRDKRRGCNNTIWAQNADIALLTISLETQVPTSQDFQEEFLNVRILDWSKYWRQTSFDLWSYKLHYNVLSIINHNFFIRVRSKTVIKIIPDFWKNYEWYNYLELNK